MRNKLAAILACMRYPRYVYLLSALILCLGFASLSFGAPVDLTANTTIDITNTGVTDYALIERGWNTNTDAGQKAPNPGNDCCINSEWVPNVRTGGALFNGATDGIVGNLGGFKYLTNTAIELQAGETVDFQLDGQSMNYRYGGIDDPPNLSLLFCAMGSCWESNHMRLTQTSVTSLFSSYTADQTTILNAIVVDMSQLFEKNDGWYELKATATPVPEPASLVLLGSALFSIGAMAGRILWRELDGKRAETLARSRHS